MLFDLSPYLSLNAFITIVLTAAIAAAVTLNKKGN